MRGGYRYTSSVTAMIASLSWQTLQHRRQQTNAIMMFRVVHATAAIPASPHLQLLEAATRVHHYRYRVPHCMTKTYKESFFPSRIRLWNQLPEDLTTAESLARPSRQEFQPPHSHRLQNVLSCFSLLLTSLMPLAMCI